MKKKILFLFVSLCVSLSLVGQDALCVYSKENIDSLSIAFRVFGKMVYHEETIEITHREGGLLYSSPYDDVQHIAFINHEPVFTSVYDTICSGETYTWNGREYAKPGVYTDTLQNIYGCDSIVELHLEVLPDPTLTFTVNGVSFNMMRVRAGTFTMGSTDDDPEAQADEKPAHEVTLTRDYFIAETMLTQELWTAVMGTTIQEEEQKGDGGTIGFGYGANFPMYYLSYNDCLGFVEKLNALTGLTFRVPTEAEWEYAARGGHLSRGYKYPGSDNVDEVAWTTRNAPDKKLRQVKLLKPNELGVYDMAGNVWEWICDYRREYTADAQIDPVGSLNANKVFFRGGSSAVGAEYCRVSCRGYEIPIGRDSKQIRRAFRFVLDADRVLSDDNKIYQLYDTICSGDVYVWNGKKYYYSGSYVDTLQNVYGCDSIVELHLTVYPSYNNHETVVACGSYEFNPFNVVGGGVVLNKSGIYSDTVVSIHGCDSIATIHLTVLPEAATTTESVVIGSNELPYTWRSQEYNATGVYSDVEKYALADCDSAIHVLNLTVLATGAVDRQSLAVCESALPYEWYGQKLTATGEYTHIEKYAGTSIDSVKHVLDFVVNKGVVVSYTVVECDSYTWSDGNTYTMSGVYYDSLKTVNGCDSVEVLYLTINYRDTLFLTETACDSYEWHGNTYTTSGTYYYNTKTVLGCDSVEVLYLTINYRDTLFLMETACDSYEWHGNTYTTSGTYYYNTKTVLGCDSVEELKLTVNYRDTLFLTETACDSYEWHGETYTTSGTYYYYTQTVLGCDSVEELKLTVNYRDTLFLTETACDSYEWHGNTYTESGTYYYNTTTVLGCDSVEELKLTLNYRDTLFLTETACDSYEWHGNTYTESGTYYYNTTTVLGCDSVEELTLTINYSTYFTYDTTVCGSYIFAGEELIESGTYVDTIENAVGCDSIITLNLIVNPITPTEYVYDTICSDELPYIFNDSVYNVAGVYDQYYRNQYGCDSNFVLTLEVVERLVVEVDSLPNLCADDQELVINFEVLQGEFDSLQIRFLNDTVPAELYTQTIYDNSISEVVYTFDSTIWVDSYTAQLEFYQHTSCGNQVFELPFAIQYDASIIVQKWDYFLALQNANYNGGYTFIDYQWYKNGEPIHGEKGASLHQYLDSTAYYYALLTRDDGLVMRTCDYRPNLKLGLPEFPTLVRVLQNVYVANTTYSAPIETITIYSELGQYVSTTRLVDGEGNVVMPGIEGNYIVKIETIDGQIISQLLLVLW